MIDKNSYSVGGKNGIITQASRVAGRMTTVGATSKLINLPMPFINAVTEYGTGVQSYLQTGSKIGNATWGALIPAAYGATAGNVADSGVFNGLLNPLMAYGRTAAQATGDVVAKGNISASEWLKSYNARGGNKASAIESVVSAVLTVPGVVSKVIQNNKTTLKEKVTKLTNGKTMYPDIDFEKNYTELDSDLKQRIARDYMLDYFEKNNIPITKENIEKAMEKIKVFESDKEYESYLINNRNISPHMAKAMTACQDMNFRPNYSIHQLIHETNHSLGSVGQAVSTKIRGINEAFTEMLALDIER